MLSPQLQQLEERFVAWATAQPAIRAVIVCGSTERQVNPGDEWADLDFEIYATGFGEFVANPDWLKNFGTVWTHLQVSEGDGPIFLTLYDEGEKVDFHFLAVQELQRLVDAQELHSAYFRGYRPVVDKDGMAARLPPPLIAPPPLAKPTAAEFAFQVNGFWYGALYVAKQIRRRNLWVVKFRDWTTKESLLKMLEWHAQAQNGWEHDTWHDGHFVDQWVDPKIQSDLERTFGRYSASDSWQTLLASLNLFRRLATETAESLGYEYPAELEVKVVRQIKRLYEEDDLAK